MMAVDVVEGMRGGGFGEAVNLLRGWDGDFTGAVVAEENTFRLSPRISPRIAWADNLFSRLAGQ